MTIAHVDCGNYVALVEELLTSRDGQIRGARVRTHSSGNRTTILNRPVQRLYPLEVHSADDREEDSNTSPSTSEGLPMPLGEGRPTRRAAVEARERTRIHAMDLDPY